jgi:predicted transcriptional regulator of viral defense system
MNRLIDLVVDAGYAERILSERQMARLIGGSDDSRYSLVKRALRSGELLKIRRGQYVLADKYRKQPVHPFHLAQAIVPGSYVSMESALAYQGWIPEAVYSVTSVTPGRKTESVDHERYGRFTFSPLAVHRLAFLEGVERCEVNQHPVLIAKPLRALLDMVAYRKVHWKGLSWITEGLRIDSDALANAPLEDFAVLRRVYKHKAVLNFIDRLEQDIVLLEAQQGSDTDERATQ